MSRATHRPRHGTPPGTSGTTVTFAPGRIAHYLSRAHRLRAAALRRGLRRAALACSRAFDGLRRARAHHRAIAELGRLSNRTLRDIGIERGQIPYVVEQMMRRRNAGAAEISEFPSRTSAAPPARPSTASGDERCRRLAA